MKTTKQPFLHTILATCLLLVTSFTACKKDKPAAELPKPRIDKVEIGSNNNEIGIIGRDFHFNALVEATTKIESVQIKIQPRADQSYSKAWSFEKTWPQYRDARNATVHEHFSIPADAAEGTYDFLIIVADQNGTILEEKRTIRIYLAENLPVNPTLTTFVIQPTEPMLRNFYSLKNGGFADDSKQLNKNENVIASATISNIKGDGKLYILLINKKHNHRPETINAIDFSKAIVWDVFKHNNVAEVSNFPNTVDRSTTPLTTRKPQLLIGAAADNNAPTPNSITALKAWESGDYYIGIIYENTTFNMGLFNYIEVAINYN